MTTLYDCGAVSACVGDRVRVAVDLTRPCLSAGVEGRVVAVFAKTGRAMIEVGCGAVHSPPCAALAVVDPAPRPAVKGGRR